MEERKILGVIGGLGPMSSAFFYELVTENTLAEKDQDHLDIVISSRASTPDRTDYILGLSDENPLPVMREEAQKLVSYGCTVLALTCNTAHYFYEELSRSVEVPILNIGSLAVNEIKERGIKKVGLMATSGTVKCGIYQQACGEKGIECLTPDDEDQKTVMNIIYGQVKAGKDVDMDAFRRVSESLISKGAEVLILGCTELSNIRRTAKLDDRYIDPLEILAKASVVACGGKLNEQR